MTLLFSVADTAARPKPAEADTGAAVAPSREVVVLLHGICKSRLDMKPLEWALRKQGYEVLNWGYPSRAYTMEELSDQLAAEVAQFQNRRVNFVTHSMGGIIVRHYLTRHQPTNVGRFVMIAPPNQGAHLADVLGNWGVYRAIFGPAGRQLRQGGDGRCCDAGLPKCEFGVIAGGFGWKFGVNPLVPGDNDGIVSVACTQLEGMKDFVVLPYTHLIIPFMPKTIRQTIRFLKSGRFSHSAMNRKAIDASADQRTSTSSISKTS